MDTLAYAIAVEEIGRVWGSLGLIVAAHTSLGCGPLHLAGTKEQKDRYLVPMASGKVIGAYGLTEPGRRLGRRRHADDRPLGGRRGDNGADWSPDAQGEWVVDGSKRFITNAGQAGTYIITARTGSTRRRPGRDLGVHPARRHARLPSGPHRGQARPPRVGDRRARVRPLPDPGGEPARRARRRLPDVPEDPRRRPDQHRRARGRDRPGRLRRVGAVRADARAVRQADRQLPGRRVHDRRHGDRDRGRPGARLEVRLAQGPGPRLLARRGGGEALRVRGQLTRDERRDPGPRRLRLRDRVPGRALPARRQAHRDRRGHEPGPAPRHRAEDPRASASADGAGQAASRSPRGGR